MLEKLDKGTHRSHHCSFPFVAPYGSMTDAFVVAYHHCLSILELVYAVFSVNVVLCLCGIHGLRLRMPLNRVNACLYQVLTCMLCAISDRLNAFSM